VPAATSETSRQIGRDSLDFALPGLQGMTASHPDLRGGVILLGATALRRQRPEGSSADGVNANRQSWSGAAAIRRLL
jgi:hypothetical protein